VGGLTIAAIPQQRSWLHQFNRSLSACATDG
jgi:hypothetical protein